MTRTRLTIHEFIVLGVIGALGSPPVASSQELGTDLQAMASALARTPRIALDVSVEVYSNESLSRTPTRMRISFRKFGTRLLYRVSGTTILQTDSATVIADDQARTIAYTAHAQVSKDSLLGSLTRIHDAVAIADSVRFRGTENGARHYSVYGRHDGSIVRIAIDTEMNALMRVVYERPYPNDTTIRLIDIKYDWLAPTIVIEAELDPAHFVSRSAAGHLAVAPAYVGYRLELVTPP